MQGGGCTDKPTERDEDEEDCRILKKNESNDETHDTEADVVEIDADDNPEKLPEMLVVGSSIHLLTLHCLCDAAFNHTTWRQSFVPTDAQCEQCA